MVNKKQRAHVEREGKGRNIKKGKKKKKGEEPPFRRPPSDDPKTSGVNFGVPSI